MSKNLVLTIAIGLNYLKILELTSPTMQAYADKIGADFKVILHQDKAETYPYWEKFVIHDLFSLLNVDRILYLDVDTIIRSDCPNLFDVVPEDKLGMYNEGLLTNASERTEHTQVMQHVFQEYNQPFPELWDGRFYNTGVMVVPSSQKDLFKKPNHEMFGNFWDQAYLNMEIIRSKIDVFDIGYKFDRMYYVDKKVKEHRLKSYIVHYAGIQNLIPVIEEDLRLWKIWEKNQKIFE